MSDSTTGNRRRSPAIFAAVLVLSAAGAFAVLGPSADTDHTVAAGNPESSGYGSNNEAVATPPQLGEVQGWIPGSVLDPPAQRSCVTAPLNDLGADGVSLRSWTAINGGDATVHLSVGGDPSATVAKIREAAATCPPQNLDGVTVHVVGVYPLAGIDGIEVRYGTDSAASPEIVSVWVANGQILAGATGAGVDELDWAVLLDALAAASVSDTVAQSAAGNNGDVINNAAG